MNEISEDVNFLEDRMLDPIEAFYAAEEIFRSGRHRWIMQYFRQTRDYRGGLDYLEFVQHLFMENAQRVPNEEFQYWMRKIFRARLDMYDRADMWERYVDYTDLLILTQHWPHYNPGFFKTCNRRYICRDNGKAYIHFTAQYEDRYELNLRKLNMLRAGKDVSSMRHHNRSELTNEQLLAREQNVTRYFCLFNRRKPYAGI
jgi:hypothetical protein